MMINGNVQGIKAAIVNDMEGLYDITTDRDEFVSAELLDALARFTQATGREISVYISRAGDVIDVSVGDAATVRLADMSLRRAQNRLSQIRCIHTHPTGDAMLSGVDIQSMIKLRLDAMAALGVRDGKACALSCAFIDAGNGGPPSAQLEMPVGIYQIPQAEWMRRIYDRQDMIIGDDSTAQRPERALLMGFDDKDSEPMKELASLAETAGVEVVALDSQRRPFTDPATYIGKGKAQELSLSVQAMDIDVCVFNDELSGAQVRNLEQIIGCRVVDRTILILDIFAKRAQSREGKLQVELAQLKYNTSRLTGLGVALSRLGGGIGTRGPGETKLEIDRRHIRSRIEAIERDLAAIEKQRGVRRHKRERNETPVVALVGYTNAGKSTLLNALSGANVYVEDKLFATLDPTTRRIDLPDGCECLLVDTVGFISKLPHALIDAFRSTLEEALRADLLVIVADASSPNIYHQQRVVDEVLTELGAGDKQRVVVFNKADKAMPFIDYASAGAISISAKQGQGLDDLKRAIERKLAGRMVSEEMLIPYSRGDALAFIHENGKVKSEAFEDTGTRIAFSMDEVSYARLRKMIGA